MNKKVNTILTYKANIIYDPESDGFKELMKDFLISFPESNNILAVDMLLKFLSTCISEGYIYDFHLGGRKYFADQNGEIYARTYKTGVFVTFEGSDFEICNKRELI